MRVRNLIAVALALAWALPASAADVPKDKASVGGGPPGVSGGASPTGGMGMNPSVGPAQTVDDGAPRGAPCREK